MSGFLEVPGAAMFVVRESEFVAFYLLLLCSIGLCQQRSINRPNFVIFLADDMGFGDLQSYGNAISTTPNIDALEKHGLKFTQFYSGAPMCSPARASLLTGRYAIRSGIWEQGNYSVFNQALTGGLPHDEVTIPEMLAKQGYKSALIGKWHLGVGRHKEYLPLHHGFDEYFGIPNSHMDCPCITCFYPSDDCNCLSCHDWLAPCQLMYGDEIIEQPVDLTVLSRRMTRTARSVIQKYSCTDTQFFLIYSFFHPHVPHFAGKTYRNSTTGGVYMDSLAELDWQVGEVMDELKKSGVIENTLVIFTSDNGPLLTEIEEGGSSGIMACGKGSTFEGGTRVPTIAYWKDKISSGILTQFFSHLDIWPTLCTLSGSSPDDFDVTLDGFDFSDAILNNGKTHRHSMLYYNSIHLPYAVRNKKYKAHILNNREVTDVDLCVPGDTVHVSPPFLFDVLLDSGEINNLGNLTEYKHIILEMENLWKTELEKVEVRPSVLLGYDESAQLCCDPGCEPYPECCSCPSNYTIEMFPLTENCNLQPLPLSENHQNRKNEC